MKHDDHATAKVVKNTPSGGLLYLVSALLLVALGMAMPKGMAPLGFVPTALAQQSDHFKLIRAVEKRRHDEVVQLLQGNKLSADTRRQSDGVPLMLLAAQNGDKRMMDILLKGGANPNIKDREKGQTAMMVRAFVGDLLGVTTLIEGGANVNVTNRAQETALLLAVRQRKARVVKFLLDHDADPNKQDLTGLAPIDYAIRNRDRRIQRLLESAGAIR